MSNEIFSKYYRESNGWDDVPEWVEDIVYLIFDIQMGYRRYTSVRCTI